MRARRECASQLLTLLLLLLPAVVTAQEKKTMTPPLLMQVNWVMQGFDFSFTGFMCEFLGISGALQKEMPYLSLQQSSWKWNASSPRKTLLSDNFEREMFPEEARTMAHLTSQAAVDLGALGTRSLPGSKYLPRFLPTDATCGPLPQSGETTPSYHPGTLLVGGDSTRPLAKARNATACCERCLADPLCLHWAFGGALSGADTDASEERDCWLKTSAPLRELEAPSYTSGTIWGVQAARGAAAAATTTTTTTTEAGATVTPMRRTPSPRAIIFHGTTCFHRNESLYAGAKRDINTILIGRYMVERASFAGGLDQNEYGVLACASMVDELWVPTEWHVGVMRRLLEVASVHGKQIYVVPESVDTRLFDPAAIGADARARRRLVGGEHADAEAEERCSVLSVPGPASAAASHVAAAASAAAAAASVNIDALGSSTQDDDEQPFILSSWEAGSGRQARVVCPVHRRPVSSSNSDETHRFQFLSVFKWEFRKGWDVLLRAYWRAFTADDHVTLRLRTYVPAYVGGDSNIMALVEAFALSFLAEEDATGESKRDLSSLPEVVWEQGAVAGKREDSLSRAGMRDRYATADAFVLPTRGEGWGVPVAEAMAMALPVIVTNYSGPTAFATDDNAYLLPVLPDLDRLFYAQPDENSLVYLMRQVVLDSSPLSNIARNKGLRARADMQSLSGEVVVEAIKARLRAEAERRGWDF